MKTRDKSYTGCDSEIVEALKQQASKSDVIPSPVSWANVKWRVRYTIENVLHLEPDNNHLIEK